MNEARLRFQVTKLAATAPEGVAVKWQGREYTSGPLEIELDEEAPASEGLLDYNKRRARAEFHVRLKFPEFAGMLASLGVDPEMTRPVRAVLRSEGEILEDHGFALSGPATLAPHGLLAAGETAASVLPGH